MKLSNNPTLGYLIAALVGIVFTTLSTTANAAPSLAPLLQEQGEEEAEDMEDEDGEAIMEMAVPFGMGGQVSKKYMQAVKKLDVLLQLDLQIEEMKMICDLEEGSVRKLKVAAKAVARKQVDKWTKSMDEFQMWNMQGIDANKDDDEEEEVDIDKIDLKKVDSNTLQWLSMDMVGNGEDNGATTEKIWKKALKAALSEEQLEKFEAVQKQREKRLQEANVQFYGQMYGAELLLEGEKLDKFVGVIRETLAKHDPPRSLNTAYNSLMHIGSIRDKDFKGVLTDAQLQRWRILIGPYGGAQMWEVEEVEDLQVEDMENEDDSPEPKTAEGGDGE
jgi:hypothetical protein